MGEGMPAGVEVSPDIVEVVICLDTLQASPLLASAGRAVQVQHVLLARDAVEVPTHPVPVYWQAGRQLLRVVVRPLRCRCGRVNAFDCVRLGAECEVYKEGGT